MSGYPLFIPEFVLCTNSSLFWFKIENELREFRNYLIILILFFAYQLINIIENFAAIIKCISR